MRAGLLIVRGPPDRELREPERLQALRTGMGAQTYATRFLAEFTLSEA